MNSNAGKLPDWEPGENEEGCHVDKRRDDAAKGGKKIRRRGRKASNWRMRQRLHLGGLRRHFRQQEDKRVPSRERVNARP